ncbi:hypothetical protein L7F22_054299 [Adiantum nelumboides]|nr:hypothetical protein [Adiantum nelumboides]
MVGGGMELQGNSTGGQQGSEEAPTPVGADVRQCSPCLQATDDGLGLAVEGRTEGLQLGDGPSWHGQHGSALEATTGGGSDIHDLCGEVSTPLVEATPIRKMRKRGIIEESDEELPMCVPTTEEKPEWGKRSPWLLRKEAIDGTIKKVWYRISAL